MLPPAYPLKPPSFRFVTPSGRFETNREICLSISGHHEETWQPAWGMRTALVALRSFMETDPRGQLGGLETTDAVRRQLAAESHAFKCAACGRTNAEILKECEATAAAADKNVEGSSRSAAVVEVEVPRELRMGFRDEMEKEAAAARVGDGGAHKVDGVDAESAELAEGFVQTAPMPVTASPARQDPIPLPAGAAQGVPQPTRTVPLPNPQPPHAVRHPTAQQQQARVSNDGVPVWIDQLIVVLGVLLIAMLLKVLVA